MPFLTKRQSEDDMIGTNDPYGNEFYGYNTQNCYEEGRCSWWWSDTGSAVRYTIVSVLFFTLFAYFLGGYWHARRRIRKNLPPLAYHRWMVKRRTLGPYYGHPYPHQNPYYAQQYQQQHPDSYGMQGSSHAPPPPAYNAGDAPPPVYQPPQGSTKAAADQTYEVRRENGDSEGSAVQVPGAAVRP